MSDWIEAEPLGQAYKEYAVYDTGKKRIAGIGRWSSFTTLEEAEEYKKFLYETKEELREKAEINKISGFAGGNQDWWTYENDGWKDAEFIIVEREFTIWRKIKDAA